MRLDRFTVKSQEALEHAQRLARDHGQQELTPEHLLAALAAEPEGTVAAVLEKLGVPRDAIARESEAALARLPRVSGGSLFLGDALSRRRAHVPRADDRNLVDHE